MAEEDYLELLEEARAEASVWLRRQSTPASTYLLRWYMSNPESFSYYWLRHHFLLSYLTDEGI